MTDENIIRAAEIIKNSKHTTAFTGAGISVESGIPPFRGENGIWNKYNPESVDISFFRSHPDKSWAVIKEIFYDFFGLAEPNDAHKCIARLEKNGYIKTVITQNIDNLHQEAGSKKVYEYHGTSRTLSCMVCGFPFDSIGVSLEKLPPRCPHCMGVLKPDFVFFGEGIPKGVNVESFYEAQIADVFLVVGTTGEVMPACEIPFRAKQNGAKIIEINMEPSNYTVSTTDIFLRGKATEMMSQLTALILQPSASGDQLG
ncbi:MAG: NAD-dependent deacylase [bacterium]|nr:NAD-dependent deacylase [bacterium]